MKMIILIFSCLLFSCSQSSNTDESPRTDTVFVVGNTKKIFMNDLDYPKSGCIRYYEEDGIKYFYIETTSPGWEIGELPSEVKDLLLVYQVK